MPRYTGEVTDELGRRWRADLALAEVSEPTPEPLPPPPPPPTSPVDVVITVGSALGKFGGWGGNYQNIRDGSKTIDGAGQIAMADFRPRVVRSGHSPWPVSDSRYDALGRAWKAYKAAGVRQYVLSSFFYSGQHAAQWYTDGKIRTNAYAAIAAWVSDIIIKVRSQSGGIEPDVWTVNEPDGSSSFDKTAFRDFIRVLVAEFGRRSIGTKIGVGDVARPDLLRAYAQPTLEAADLRARLACLACHAYGSLESQYLPGIAAAAAYAREQGLPLHVYEIPGSGANWDNLVSDMARRYLRAASAGAQAIVHWIDMAVDQSRLTGPAGMSSAWYSDGYITIGPDDLNRRTHGYWFRRLLHAAIQSGCDIMQSAHGSSALEVVVATNPPGAVLLNHGAADLTVRVDGLPPRTYTVRRCSSTANDAVIGQVSSPPVVTLPAKTVTGLIGA